MSEDTQHSILKWKATWCSLWLYDFIPCLGELEAGSSSNTANILVFFCTVDQLQLKNNFFLENA